MAFINFVCQVCPAIVLSRAAMVMMCCRFGVEIALTEHRATTSFNDCGIHVPFWCGGAGTDPAISHKIENAGHRKQNGQNKNELSHVFLHGRRIAQRCFLPKVTKTWIGTSERQTVC